PARGQAVTGRPAMPRQDGHRLVRQRQQLGALGRRQIVGAAVEQAERADAVSLRRDQRRSGVEAYARRTDDDLRVRRARVFEGVRYDQELILLDGKLGDAPLAWKGRRPDADRGEDADAISLDEGEPTHHAAADRDGALRDPV